MDNLRKYCRFYISTIFSETTKTMAHGDRNHIFKLAKKLTKHPRGIPIIKKDLNLNGDIFMQSSVGFPSPLGRCSSVHLF